MKTYVQKGEILSFVASAITHPTHSDGLPHAGDPCLVGRIAGVAAITPTVSTDIVSLSIRGVHKLSVTPGGNGFSVGETIYIDPSTCALTTDLTDTPFGVALQAVAAGQTATIEVMLFGATPGATGYFS